MLEIKDKKPWRIPEQEKRKIQEDAATSRLRRDDIRSFMKSRGEPAIGVGLIDLTSDSLEASNGYGGAGDRMLVAGSDSPGPNTAKNYDGGQSDSNMMAATDGEMSSRSGQTTGEFVE